MSSSAPSSSRQKLIPNLDHNATNTLNLTVLQRVDPLIEEILLKASHVAVYDFSLDLNKWSRKNVDGAFFVVKRSLKPRFQFIVMNRHSTENLVEDLLGDFEYEVQLPYLLYRKSSQEVNGLWFYYSHECVEAGNLFSRILSEYSRVPPKGLLTPSESEFEELEAMPSSVVIESPLEPSVATVCRDDSSSNLNMIMGIGHRSSNDLTSGPLNPSKPPGAPLSSPVYIASPSLPPNEEVSLFPVISSSVPPSSTHGSEGSNLIDNSNMTARLVKPSSFHTPPSQSSLFTPPMTSSGTTPALHPLLNLQCAYGTPMLEPFPPSLATNAAPLTADYGPLKKETVRGALLRLVQDDQFIDMVYKALWKVHQS